MGRGNGYGWIMGWMGWILKWNVWDGVMYGMEWCMERSDVWDGVMIFDSNLYSNTDNFLALCQH